MLDKDPRLVIAELAERIEKLEMMVAMLCQDAAQGQGMQGKLYWDYIDEWRAHASS